MRRIAWLAVPLALFCAIVAALPAAAATPAPIRLRRATIDPLQPAPAAAEAGADSSATLRLVQLSAPPDASTEAALLADGMRPLLYIPDNAYLVRARAGAGLSSGAVRWSGPFLASYKLAAPLDALLASDARAAVALRVLLSIDADASAVEAAIRAAGGSASRIGAGLNGPSLRATLPRAALLGLAQRDDVVWIEQDLRPRLSNDRIRAVAGVDAARQELAWLSGAGQIVAVTDTGLDQQASLSADFAGRVVAGSTPQQMSSACAAGTWSDHEGHGTHVSGTALGSGASSPSGSSFAGVAPGASLVIQAVSSGGGQLDCLESSDSFLAMAYAAGARVQNASWGSPTGQGAFPPFSEEYGGYDDFAQIVDGYLWAHKDHLLVVAAGNSAADDDANGVIDGDSIGSPATAKNVLAVGASENDRPPSSGGCAASTSDPPSRWCWETYGFGGPPFSDDLIGDDPGGLAAFSGRGPADDGRIKPEIVAPGTSVISTGSHDPSAIYDSPYNADYAYLSGTSMAAPAVSGGAALVRQWLAQARGLAAPSAALVKALLLNGAADLSPGQYGAGAQREIPAAWPNNAQGWGRLDIAASVELSGAQIALDDATAGLATGQSASYTVTATAGQKLRATLAWTDYPASPLAGKTLINDLDLVIQAPDGSLIYGNGGADFSASPACHSGGADRCNNVESVAVAAAQAGAYTVRVRAHSVAHGPQPFAITTRLSAPATPLGAPALQAQAAGASSATLSWGAIVGATSYELQGSAAASFASLSARLTLAGTSATVALSTAPTYFRVRACGAAGCGDWSSPVSVSPLKAAELLRLPALFVAR